MNVFSSFADIDQGIITMVLGEIKQATEDTKTAPNKTRGAPEGKASRDSFYNENGITNQTNGGIYENEQSENPDLLEREKISTIGRSEDSNGEYSKNTKKLKGILGVSNEELRSGNFKAGQSEWLENYKGKFGVIDPYEIKRMRRFLQSFCGELSRTKLKSKDTVGRTLPKHIIDDFSETVFKTEDGKILSLWHWTNKAFNEFKYGDIGFHAGSFDASHSIMFDKSQKGEKGFFKELYFNSKKPLFIERDLGMAWTPHTKMGQMYQLDMWIKKESKVG